MQGKTRSVGVKLTISFLVVALVVVGVAVYSYFALEQVDSGVPLCQPADVSRPSGHGSDVRLEVFAVSVGGNTEQVEPVEQRILGQSGQLSDSFTNPGGE